MRSSNSSRRVVMVVDDDDSVYAALPLVPENHYDIITAASAEAAIRQLALHCVDIILLDLLMPGTDGWALFEEVRGEGMPDRGSACCSRRQTLRAL